MRKFLKILFFPLWIVNIVVAILLICCAYSPILPPNELPLLSLAGLAFPFVLAINVAFLILWLLIYPRHIIVSLTTMLICVVQIRAFIPVNIDRQKPPKESLKIVSYNILSPNINPSNTNSSNRVIKYLEEADADIICLQEFNFSNLKKNKNLLTKYPYKSYLISKDGEAASRYLGCLSKYPILSVEKLEFDSSHNGCGKYRILHEGDTIVVYNCHLQSNGLVGDDKNAYEQILMNPKESIRSKETKKLIDKLRNSAAKRAIQTNIILADLEKETSPYVIVCGDFNDSPISYTCYQLKRHLDDAYIGSGNGPGISYNRNKLYYRIDHILHSRQLKAYDCTVDRSIRVSDHYPIYCFLEKSED